MTPIVLTTERRSALLDRPLQETTIVTPEGVPVSFEIAPAGSRLAAFLVDILIIGSFNLAIGLATHVAVGLLGLDLVGAAGIVAMFVFSTLYFPLFEMRWKGATPGKRRARLRVVDARGGPLRIEAVFTRNFLREVEFWMPLYFVMAAAARDADAAAALLGLSGWTVGIVLLWCFGLFAFPLFNRRHLRIGDLVAGTMVVRMPRIVLRRDLAEEPVPAPNAAAAAPKPAIRFTPAQLDVYGEFELQVLERILREGGPKSRQTQMDVAARIRRKIGWTAMPVPDDREFLRDFYAAQRARLEERRLFGRRKESKD